LACRKTIGRKAPNEVVTKFSLVTGSLDNVRTETLRAFAEDEFRKMSPRCRERARGGAALDEVSMLDDADRRATAMEEQDAYSAEQRGSMPITMAWRLALHKYIADEFREADLHTRRTAAHLDARWLLVAGAGGVLLGFLLSIAAYLVYGRAFLAWISR
jgi:hypothetical protein